MFPRLAIRYLTILLTFQYSHSFPQDSTSINSGRLAIVVGGTALTVTGIYAYQRQAWWDGSSGEFWVVNDWVYSNGLDKLGHVYGAYALSYGFRYALEWSGVPERKSVFVGSMLGLGFELFVECLDGYHSSYGFSPGDALADIVGATLPILHWRFPVTMNFQLKWSYWPSTEYLDDLNRDNNRVFIDDYGGQRYWLAVDPHFMMGRGLRDVVPAWLGFAIGMGLTDPVPQLTKSPWTSEYFLTLDYNFSRIQPDSDFLRALFRMLDFIHLPAPGIAVKGGNVRFGIFY
jgi:VanZ family protein